MAPKKPLFQKRKKLSVKEFISILCLFLMSFLPAMKPVTAILVRGLLILPAFFHLLHWSRSGNEGKRILFGVIPLLAYAFLPIFLSSKLFLLIWLLLFLILLCYMFLPLVLYPKDKRADAWAQVPPSWLVAILMLLYFTHAERGTYIGNGALILFLISLVASVLLSLLILVKYLWKPLKRGAKIAFLLISVFLLSLGFSLLSMTANYVLDFNAPLPCSAVIEEKKYERGSRRSPGYYEFGVAVDGQKIELKVPISQYNAYEEGDEYTFYYYKGAFGVPFYIAEK